MVFDDVIWDCSSRVGNADKIIKLPFSLRSVGHYTADKGRKTNNIIKKFIQVFWGIKGEGQFIINNQKHILKPEYVFIYPEGVPHNVTALSRKWEYCYFTFDGPASASLLDNFNFPQGAFHAGPVPRKNLEELFEKINDFTPRGLCEATLALYDILLKIKVPEPLNSNSKNISTIPEAFIELVETNFSSETFNVHAAAEILGMHRATLFRILERTLKMSPIKYITIVRMQQAMQLLRTTKLPVKEISRRVGINDASYFSKLFKEFTSYSPREYKKYNRV